jgi:3-deoxy-D-manno-octulosonic-acid transferase
MRVLYSVIIALATPFVLSYFAFRGFRDRAYLGRWKERFGYPPINISRHGILLHAASVGELNAATPLIEALLEYFPDQSLTVTTLTPTGSARVKQTLGNRVNHVYVPLDLYGSVNRSLRRLQPRLIIVMESEIWPNLYLQAQQLNIPLIIANARISVGSKDNYRRFPVFADRVFGSVSWYGAQTTRDAQLLVQCGANPEQVEVAGNLKFEMDIPNELPDRADALRSSLIQGRPVLIAGSTHEADERMLIPAFVELLESLPDALLVLVPRHPERFDRAVQLAERAGLRVERRTQGEIGSDLTQCFVLDTMGELMTYYAFGDVAFVGGSMGLEGGHNALEPAALGKPVLLGPNMDSAREIAVQLLQCGAAMQIGNRQEFKHAALSLLTDRVLRENMGDAGRTLIEKNKRAVGITIGVIRRLLSIESGGRNDANVP